MKIRDSLLYFVLLIVALCSIVYELLFCQALSAIYGNTVTRYSITIGLFLFALGMGAFLYKWVARQREAMSGLFFSVELVLSLVGPAGLSFIFFTASLGLESPGLEKVALVLAHLPIVLVGLLSGLEIPALNDILTTRESRFPEVLGFDYLGSLVGTVLYSLVLYPAFGLIQTALIIGALNMVAGALFLIAVKNQIPRRMVADAALLCVSALFAATFAAKDLVEDHLKAFYRQSVVWNSLSARAKASIHDLQVVSGFSTPYQEVIEYSYYDSELARHVRCMNLDSHPQLCDVWAEGYHNGLVDLPMAFFAHSRPARVLLLGGGDGIALNHLKAFGAEVDMVDLDSAFVEYARTSSFLGEFHKDAFAYARAHIIIDDALHFLRTNRRRYDIVLFDLPGLKEEKMLPLYSVEFFSFIHRSLESDGFFVMWTYGGIPSARHQKGLVQTLRSAGFEHLIRYSALVEMPDAFYPGEAFLLLPKRGPLAQPVPRRSPYLEATWEYYRDRLHVGTIPEAPAGSANSIFRPKQSMVVGRYL